MERAGLVVRVRRAVYRLTADEGRLLEQETERVDDKVLRTYPAFVEWERLVQQRREREDTLQTEPAQGLRRGSHETPEE